MNICLIFQRDETQGRQTDFQLRKFECESKRRGFQHRLFRCPQLKEHLETSAWVCLGNFLPFPVAEVSFCNL